MFSESAMPFNFINTCYVLLITTEINGNCENVSTLSVIPQEKKNVVFTAVRKQNNKVHIFYCHYPTLDLGY